MNSNLLPDEPPIPDDASSPPSGENPPSAFSEATQKVTDAARQTAQSVQETAERLSETAKAKSAEFVEKRKAQIDRDPTTAVLQALLIGIGIGLLFRLLEGSKDKRGKGKIDVGHKPTLEETKFHLGSVFLPLVWPFYQGARRQYQRSAVVAHDAIEQAKKVKEADLRKLGRKSVKKVEEWFEDEITPTVECGWKRLRKLWS